MNAPSDVAVQVHVRDPWAAVPRRLMEAGCGLSPLARLVLIYVLDLGQRPGWVIYASQARRALGLTEARWKRARRELEAGGYFVKHRGHAADGDWLWTYHIFDTPQVTADEADGGQISIGAKRTDAKRTGAKQSDRRRNTLHSSTQRIKAAAEAPRAERAAPPPAAAGAAANEKEEGQKQKRQQRLTAGVVCWTDADREVVEELISTHSVQAVRQAATRLRAAGVDPLPSAVAKALQEAVRAALQARAEAEAERQEADKRAAREAERAVSEARRADPAARARLAALIAATAKKLGSRTT